MISVLELTGLCPSPSDTGFSAFLSTLSTSSSTFFTGWTITSPYFGSGNFTASTGSYTVPETGLYALKATVNYTTDSTITVSLGAGITPALIIRRTAPASSDLIGGLLPLLDVNVTVLTLRSVLGAGTVTLSGIAQLSEGDVVRLYYDSDTMTVPLTFENTVWSMYLLC